MPEPTVDAVRSLVSTLLTYEADRVEPYRPPFGGNDSHSFLVWTRGTERLLKVKKHPGSPIGIYFHERLKNAGVPVPELIAFGADAGPEGEACAIWEWIDGESAEWEPGEPCPYDEAEFGELLRRIHDLEYDGPFGILGDAPPESSFTWHADLGPASSTWPGFFHCDRAASRCFDRGVLNQSEADALSSLPNLLGAELDRVEPRLLHMGNIFHNGNMILDPVRRRILAVVDYVESMVGDPRWELAWVDYYFSQLPSYLRVPFDMDRFRSGYGTEHDPHDPLGQFYLVAILMMEDLRDLTDARTRWSIDTLRSLLTDLVRS